MPVTSNKNILVSVIIPYFQRERGILRRALESVLRQRLELGITVNVIVVDDGSPVSAQSEAEGLDFTPPFHLTIIPQSNGGVSIARNTGLKSVNVATKYIAFLDSDDTWREGHLAQGIEALEQGNDFYFCDNERDGYHTSHFSSGTLIFAFIGKDTDKEGIIKLTRDEVTPIILREFATQASTVVYRRDIAPDLLFDTSFTKAGEDIIFLLQLINKTQKICFSSRIMVDCGTGINIYFSNLDWNSAGHLSQVIYRLKAHLTIQKGVELTQDNIVWNKSFIATLRRKVVFLSLRQIVRNKGKCPDELKALAREDKWFYVWFPLYLFQVVTGKILGLYNPS